MLRVIPEILDEIKLLKQLNFQLLQNVHFHQMTLKKFISSKVHIKNNGFSDNHSIKIIIFSSSNISIIKSSAFARCQKLMKIDLSPKLE